jgi:hypothetical protein
MLASLVPCFVLELSFVAHTAFCSTHGFRFDLLCGAAVGWETLSLGVRSSVLAGFGSVLRVGMSLVAQTVSAM